MEKDYFVDTVLAMKEQDGTYMESVIREIEQCADFTHKCILFRKHLKPQSHLIEMIIKKDLGISNTPDKHSGDGIKQSLRYEIKFSGHAKKSILNFVQLRPGHNIDFYILCGYNMYSTKSAIGEAFILKIPSAQMHDLIVRYGHYAHGTKSRLGSITHDTIRDHNKEYVIRCDPNALKGKSYHIWNELLRYRVEYDPSYF